MILLALTGTVAFSYLRFSSIVEQRLHAGPYANTASIYSASERIAPRDPLTAAGLVTSLRRSGYGNTPKDRNGWYLVSRDGVDIYPGRAAASPPVRISFNKGVVSAIRVLNGGAALNSYRLGPQLLANLSEQNFEKRDPVSFSRIPKLFIEAIVSAEDKRFFQHSGVDLLRIGKAAWVDLREGRKEQGASTLTMQLARTLWLDPQKSWRRKASEVLIALHLEQKLSKAKIFEYYFNQVYLGRQGPYNIHGFAEAARVFFNKDIQRLSVAEAATLAGMVQRPSYWDPVRFPGRVQQRRNVVLALMRQNGYIDNRTYLTSVASPLVVKPGGLDAAAAPFFVDMVENKLRRRIGPKYQAQALTVYTTLDPELQRAAAEAVRIGMARVDALVGSRNGEARPQVALVALDPHTGEIKALSGGRDYQRSQLNHALAFRQPGSVFKPFVYAAALDSAVTGGRQILTPASTVEDRPTTFWYRGRPYAPANFKNSFYDTVTLRSALAHSLNVATVRVAELAGYGRVARLAQQAGWGDNIQPTPALALGAYEATPVDVAGAYTVYSNQGVYAPPRMIRSVRSNHGLPVYLTRSNQRVVLDPRVAYLIVSMLEGVMRRGTGAGARSHGFTVPAAGKTGTSRDGWFAGFTSNLLCVVWVGYDDNRDLGLEGARSALPIWTEFMKRAHQLSAYRDARPFRVPAGIVSVAIDSGNGLLANPFCPSVGQEVFIDGTAPTEYCTEHQPDGDLETAIRRAQFAGIPEPQSPVTIPALLPTPAAATQGDPGQP